MTNLARAATARPDTQPRRFRRLLAGLVAAALATGGLVAATAAPANASVTDTTTNASLTWGFSTYSQTWGVVTTGNVSLVDAASTASRDSTATYTTSKGFTLGSGTGSVTDGVGSVSFVGSVTYSPFAGYGAQAPYAETITFSNFVLATSTSTRGTLTADVSYAYSDSISGSASRVVIANFNVSTNTVTDGAWSLVTADPDWTGVVEPGKYSADFSDSWPTALVDVLNQTSAGQSNGGVYFYRTGTTPGNTNKVPLSLSATATIARPTITATITSSTPTGGLVVSVAGDGFRGVTKTGDTGIYVGIAPSGGAPGYSISDAASYVGVAYVRSDGLSDGAFSTQVSVPTAKLDKTKSYSIYTWQAHAHSNTTQDTETALTIDWASLRLPSTTSLKLSATTQAYGKNVTLTATVPSGATGKVEFFDGSKSLGVASVSGAKAAKTVKLSAGTHRIKASYRGNDSYAASTSSIATLRVTKATTSKVTVSGKKFAKKSKPKVTVTVAKLNNGAYPVGKVKVYVGGKLVKTVALTASAKGKLSSVKLAKKYSTAIKVKAVFAPSDTTNVSGKSSATVTIKVKKK